MILQRAYGLTIATDVGFPELPQSDCATPDIVVSAAHLGTAQANARQVGPHIWVSATTLTFEVPGIGRYQIEGGAFIRYDAAPDIDIDSVRLFLLSSALAAALLQRGFFLLHGCAVEVAGKICVAVGHSGIGKSTLGEGLRRRGHRLLADDVVATNAEGRVLPGIPRVKLWQDVVDKLAIEATQMTRVRPNLAKYQLMTDEFPSDGPLPIDRVYALSTHHEPTVAIKPISGLEAFAVLRRNSYRQRFADALGLQADHLRIAMRIASTGRIAQLVRPRDGFDLEALVDAVEADAADG